MGGQPFLTVHAHNLWWIITWFSHSLYLSDAAPVFGTVSVRFLSLLFLGFVVLIVCARPLLARLSRQAPPLESCPSWPFAYAAILGLAFFELPTEMHENYLYLACLFGATVACRSRPLFVAYCILSLGWSLNMLLMDPAITAWLRDAVAGASAPWQSFARFVYLNRGPDVAANGSLATLVNAVVIAIAAAGSSVLLFRVPRRAVINGDISA